MMMMPRIACTRRDDHCGSLTTDSSFVNIDITVSAVLYAHGPACPDGAQRAHPRGAAAGGGRSLPRPGRRGHVGRADRGRRRGVAADLLSPLRVQARSAVRRLRRRPAVVPRRAGGAGARRADHRVGPIGDHGAVRTTTGRSPRSRHCVPQELDPGPDRAAHPRRSRPISPKRSRSTSAGTTRRSPAPTSGCASRSPRGASRPRCSARWRCGCSARTARCPS